MRGIIEARRKFSSERFNRLLDSLTAAPEICAEKACVYATGSFGRQEASSFSDLDLFIVSLSNEKDGVDRSHLSKLDEILLKADLIRASKELKFPDFFAGRQIFAASHRKKTHSINRQSIR